MTQTILITGANRGIGLELVKQYAETGAKIIATCRNPHEAAALSDLAQKHNNIDILTLDVTSQKDIDALKSLKTPVDILINNAGYLEHDDFNTVTVDSLTDTFLINAVAPLMLTRALQTHLSQGQSKLVVNISSRAGSIGDNDSGGYYSYRASKAALNMLMKSASIDLAASNLRFLLMHPGWVKTRMGGTSAQVDVQDSAKGIIHQISQYDAKPGDIHFIRFDNGQTLPW